MDGIGEQTAGRDNDLCAAERHPAAPNGRNATKRGRSDEGRSGRTTRTAREAIRIIGPLANDEDDDEKTTAEQGTASAVVFSLGATLSSF